MGARRTSLHSKDWLQERKEVLDKIKSQVRLYLGDETPDIKDYARYYKEDLKRPWVPSDWSKVFVCLEQVNLVFGGDFHPFAQAQRTHLRLLRKVVAERPLVLAMECLSVSDQDLVDAFMADQIDEEEFLKKVEWEQRWGFPWKNYRPLFEFAKKQGVKIYALNEEVGARSGVGLRQRDNKAAEILKGLLQKYPDSLIYVLYGDLHIAHQHLPRELTKICPPQVEVASFYLNSEKIYFELASQGLEGSVEVVEFNSREFCLLSSPPWVKWHSYLMYLEENFDVDLEFEDDDFEEDEEWEFQIDHTDHVSDLVKMIAAALSENIKADDIEVYSLQDPQAMVVTEKELAAEEYALAHNLILNDRSFYIPAQGFFYLSKSTVNHAATLAGQYIHAKICGREKMMWNFPDDFKKVIWIEAMAFLLSKFVNPKRKSQTMSDLKKQLEAFDKKDRGREPLLLALDQKMIELLAIYEQEPVQTYAPGEKSSYIHAARFIGEILGDRYFILYQKQIIDIDIIRALLRQSLESKDFDQYYLDQLKNLDRLELEGSSSE